jgi:zinc-ribbon domain
MSAITASCPNCNTALPPDARFCAGCGRRVGQDPTEITWEVADRRTFGVLPGRSRMRAARIRTVRLFGLVRAQVVLAVEIVRAHFQEQRERYRLHRRAAVLAKERSVALQRLGEASLYGDRQDVRRAKAHVTGLDAELQSVSEELELIEHRLDERVAAVQREEGATRAVEPVPEPAPEPEPSPVPSDPPGPVIVPEPEPVPHEPPGPVIVPEPQPRTRAAKRR